MIPASLRHRLGSIATQIGTYVCRVVMGRCGRRKLWGDKIYPCEDHTYKNAITNEWFLLLCTRICEVWDSTYLNDVQVAWNWCKFFSLDSAC
ncbi:hypothetical protein BDN72DRAFT_377244 [Pluteus cervinus]|uniref:Uncharacterized protein n=1 Tax=Pluteus cervinus TaxID=181527 RepID=A0ACD3AAZ5_9AGAR|nr:hypothetical protein BDN72DRAFT_377244 [Pluteus cervinus]